MKAVKDNTIKFTGNKIGESTVNSATDAFSLSKNGGIVFSILGDTTTGDIVANASGTSVTLNLNKITSSSDFVSGATKVATAGIVYDAIRNAKPKISVTSNSYLSIDKGGDRTGITGDDFTLTFNSDKLKTDIQNSLSGHFTIVDDHKIYNRSNMTMNLSESDVAAARAKNQEINFDTTTAYEIYQIADPQNPDQTLARFFKVQISEGEYAYFNTTTKQRYMGDASALTNSTISTFVARDAQKRDIALNKGLKLEGDGFITVEYLTPDNYDENGLTDAPTLKIRASDAVTAALTKIAQTGGSANSGIMHYKINDGAEQAINLLYPGLHFKGGDNNIVAMAGDTDNDGLIRFKLSENLSQVNSIGSGATDELLINPERGARLSFAAGIKGANLTDPSDDVAPTITANKAKLTGLVDGRIGTGSSDAITGNQLFDLVGTNDNAHGSINYRITNLENGAAGPVVYRR